MADGFRFEIIAPPADSRNWDITHWEQQGNVKITSADIRGVGPRRQLYFLRHSFEYDLFHSLSSYLPLFVKGSSLVTIHDLKYVHFPSYFRGLGILKHRYITTMIRRSVRSADHVLTVSNHARSDIVAEFGVDEEQITVIPHGPGGTQTETNDSPPVDGSFLFFVGSLRPHKNLDTLVDAYIELRARTDQTAAKLVIAGAEYGDSLTELREQIPSSYRDDVEFLGRVDDETLATLYEHATVFVYPSLYEGFGLPPLEAMAHGTPVIASDRTSIPEVVGDAGVYIDPTNKSDLTDALERVLTSDSLRNHLREQGRQRYKEFSWNRTARETLTVYERILSDT
ncbi:group 1 glycosyl transferase [Halococcus morrhuae DSM 1307]|uniref:Group 1 glycosyl transferase n=2 Tax=Halococcus morrhuae TaxID=2250 RepID=M0M2M9_HALMO|nr:group 1 glycosyl transferase [Halococcus morrhuae DSM 1307]